MQSAQPVSSQPSFGVISPKIRIKSVRMPVAIPTILLPQMWDARTVAREDAYVYHIVADQNRTQHFARILYDLQYILCLLIAILRQRPHPDLVDRRQRRLRRRKESRHQKQQYQNQ